MNSDDLVILEWKYSPENFFEAPFDINGDGYEIHIGDGQATAKIHPDIYDKNHRKREELHTIVDGYFRAIQIIAHQKYRLPKPSMYRQYQDGRRDIYAILDSALQIKIGMGRPDQPF